MTRNRWELLTAGDMMKTDIVSVNLDADCREIETVMMERGVSGVAVRDASARIIGVISWRDVVDRGLKDAQKKPHTNPFYAGAGAFDRLGVCKEGGTAKARELMNQHLLTISKTAGLKDVAGMMSEYRIHRLFVTAEDGKIEGILSTLDVMDAMSA